VVEVGEDVAGEEVAFGDVGVAGEDEGFDAEAGVAADFGEDLGGVADDGGAAAGSVVERKILAPVRLAGRGWWRVDQKMFQARPKSLSRSEVTRRLNSAAAAGFSPTVTYDRVPLGEVEVQRGDRVEATDGSIGRIHGLVVDPHDHQVTHVLLQEGHLWGRKDVAIPIKAVSRVGDTIRLNISKQEVQDLPPVDFAQHGG